MESDLDSFARVRHWEEYKLDRPLSVGESQRRGGSVKQLKTFIAAFGLRDDQYRVDEVPGLLTGVLTDDSVLTHVKEDRVFASKYMLDDEVVVK